MGVKKDRYEVEEWETGEFFVGASIRDRLKNIRCEVITVYGPADHQWSNIFLEELDTKFKGVTMPVILGGDFNLIRDLSDKSTGVGDQRLISAFNSFIENNHLREIYRAGPKFTWTNKQSNPVMSNIDRILASTEWDLKFPTCCLNTLTRVGSDHCPLLLDTGGLLRGESTGGDSFSLRDSGSKWKGSLK
jgi:exonuclease III